MTGPSSPKERAMKRLLLICVMMGCTDAPEQPDYRNVSDRPGPADDDDCDRLARPPGQPPCPKKIAVESAAIATAIPPNLEPVATLGLWGCRGHYEDTPFTVAHDVAATFDARLATGATWIDGQYNELSTGGIPPFSISEHWTVDPFGNGARRFEDNQYGRLEASLEVVDGGVEFMGVYKRPVPGAIIEVPYTESLRFGPRRTTFTTESRVILPVGPGGEPVPVVFHRQTCALVRPPMAGGAQ